MIGRVVLRSHGNAVVYIGFRTAAGYIVTGLDSVGANVLFFFQFSTSVCCGTSRPIQMECTIFMIVSLQGPDVYIMGATFSAGPTGRQRAISAFTYIHNKHGPDHLGRGYFRESHAHAAIIADQFTKEDNQRNSQLLSSSCTQDARSLGRLFCFPSRRSCFHSHNLSFDSTRRVSGNMMTATSSLIATAIRLLGRDMPLRSLGYELNKVR